MATFKSLNESDNVDGKYSGRKRIYLESDEDLAIFERWFFDEGEFIEFKSSCDTGSGGCTRVKGLVDKDRNLGILSFGLVDRDALMREQKWDVFWESDDEVFLDARPFGEYIRPLSRWEIENYLLEPDVIETLLTDYGSYSPKGIDKKKLASKLLLHSESLIPVMAVNICLHNAGIEALPQRYAIDEKSPELISEKCCKHLETNSIKCDYEKIRQRLFSFKSGDDDFNFFWNLSRVIDGKRLFLRFDKEFGLKEDHKFHLARLIREKGCIASELDKMIQEFKNAA